jgi:tight adherence protein C
MSLIIAIITAAVVLGVLVTGTAVRERAEVRRSLRALEGYQITGVRDQEMLSGFGQRVLEPLGTSIRDWVKKITPVGYVEQVKRKVVLAGNPPGFEVDRLLVLKVVGSASPLVWLPLVYLGLELGGLMAMLIAGFLCVVSFLGADLAIDNKIEARKEEIARRLPDMLDLLVISVEAGLGFEQALDRTANAVPGPLSDEFRRMLQETRIGATRSDALRAMDERTDVPELRSFILAMLQADTFGVSIARILRTQAEEMRVRRRLAAQELAQKAPVKMLFPLAICIFPAIFIVVLGPAFIAISESL